jgi:glycine/D-amino acid oxidase-like deaminating enzyme
MRVAVVGAGVHGLSVAYHLAEAGADVVVLEKTRVGAGASGVSGGIVRNFYRSPVMHELVRRSVEIFEVDPSLFGFRQVGYIAVVPEAQAEELEGIAEAHADVGYASTLVVGEERVAEHMRARFPDWRASGSAALLHEQRSGWADAETTVKALAGMARTQGARIVEGVEVTSFGDGSVETTAGVVECDAVVLAAGSWIRDLLPELDFHFWQVREGDYEHRGGALDPRDPVVHLDADVPLADLPVPWGIYFRPGLGRGVACGGLPLELPPDVELDPYGPSHPEHGKTTSEYDRQIEAALSWALGRFAGESWSASSFGAATSFTPDSYPVVGFVRDGVYAIVDSNHGFKLLALGQLAAQELLGREAPELAPFRADRFAEARLHPASASPYPWT